MRNNRGVCADFARHKRKSRESDYVHSLRYLSPSKCFMDLESTVPHVSGKVVKTPATDSPDRLLGLPCLVSSIPCLAAKRSHWRSLSSSQLVHTSPRQGSFCPRARSACMLPRRDKQHLVFLPERWQRKSPIWERPLLSGESPSRQRLWWLDTVQRCLPRKAQTSGEVLLFPPQLRVLLNGPSRVHSLLVLILQRSRRLLVQLLERHSVIIKGNANVNPRPPTTMRTLS